MHDQSNFYAVIPAFVREDRCLSNSAKILYGEIAALTTRSGFCWASNRHLAAKFQVSARSISRWIMLLQRRGHVRVEIEDWRRRKIRIAAPGNTSRRGWKKMSWGIDRFVQGDRQNCLPSNTKRNTDEKNTPIPPRGSREGVVTVSSSLAFEFVNRWQDAYRKAFGVAYKVHRRQDLKAARELLALDGYTTESLLSIARQAWGNHTGFNCKFAATLVGFSSRFNQIRIELGLTTVSTSKRFF